MKWVVPLLICFSDITLLPAQAPVVPGSLKICYYSPFATTTPIPAGFLTKAKAAGYTHILAEFSIYPHRNEWKDGRYAGSGGSFPMREGLRAAFRRADSFGLRLIPEFQLGGKWAGIWNYVNNPNIHYELLNYGIPGPPKESGCPIFAPDSLGIDFSFEQLIRMIGDAYSDAHLKCPLEYINLGHDEAREDIGGGQKLLIGQSDLDRAWMKKHPGTSSYSSLEMLMADEISRRVATVKKIIPSARVMIHADMWDPEMNGGLWHTANAIKTPAAQDVKTRNNLILIPWSFEKISSMGRAYTTKKAFDHFIQNGYMFLFGTCLGEGNTTASTSRYYQMAEYMITAAKPEYRAHIGGFIVYNWGGVWDDSKPADRQMACFDAMEYSAGLYRDIISEK